jgi:cystathionine gamma-synthase
MSATTVTETKEKIPLGGSVPALTPHAISVSLPTWKDNVGYEEGEKRVVDSMVSGYPRFFIHLKIQKVRVSELYNHNLDVKYGSTKLMRICEAKFGTTGESCLLFPTYQIADECRQFMVKFQSPSPIRLVQFLLCPEDQQTEVPSEIDPLTPMTLHIVLFPKDAFSIAKQFWQHTGLGISSRFAVRCLRMLPDAPSDIRGPPSPTAARFPFKSRNKHYSSKEQPKAQGPPVEDTDRDTYLEERYGRNLPLSYAAYAKRAMRRRIAGTLVRDVVDDDCAGGLPCAGGADVEIGPSSRGVTSLTEDDVFLYPTGMSAIWIAHRLARETLPLAKSVCFG